MPPPKVNKPLMTLEKISFIPTMHVPIPCISTPNGATHKLIVTPTIAMIRPNSGMANTTHKSTNTQV